MNPRPDKHAEPSDPTSVPDASLSGSSTSGAVSGADDYSPALSDTELATSEGSSADAAYEVPKEARVDVSGGGLGSIWALVALGAILLILLLVFVLQNQDNIEIEFLPWSFTMPSGVIILLAAIVGALVMALAAAFRIFQLRHRARRSAKALRSGTRAKR